MDGVYRVCRSFSFIEALEKLEVLVEPLLRCNIDELVSQLADLEAAKLHAAIAYTLDTVYFMYVRVQGVHHSGHKVSSAVPDSYFSSDIFRIY